MTPPTNPRYELDKVWMICPSCQLVAGGQATSVHHALNQHLASGVDHRQPANQSAQDGGKIL
jgi:hypothetical protein